MTLKSVDWLFITVLLIFAAGLRIIGISYGQPDPQYAPSTYSLNMLHESTPMQPDEYFLVTLPVDMALHNRLNPGWFEYPSLIVNVNFVLNTLLGTTADFSQADRADQSLRVIAPFHFYVFSRMYSVLASVLTVACTYATARLIAGRFAGISAGLLTAVSFTLVQHAHYIKPGTPALGLMALAMWAAFAALYVSTNRGCIRLYLLAGAAAGLATSTRYNALSIMAVVGLIGLVLLYRHRTRGMLLTVVSSWLLVPTLFVMGTPYALLDFESFIRDFTYISGQYLTTGANVPEYFLTDPLMGLLLIYRFVMLFSLGIPAMILALVGLVSSWQQRLPLNRWFRDNSSWQAAIILLISIGVYSFVVLRTLRPGHSDNLSMLILPQIIILAAIGAAAVYRWLPTPSWISAPLVILGLIIMPLMLSVQTVSLFSQPDTRQEMQTWIYDNVPHGSRIYLNGPYNVPLDPADYTVVQRYGIYADAAEIGTADVDFLIFSDALLLDVVRSPEIVPADVIGQWQGEATALDAAFSEVARIERPSWIGSDSFMNMMAYWHNPSLTLYCLNPSSCARIEGNE